MTFDEMSKEKGVIVHKGQTFEEMQKEADAQPKAAASHSPEYSPLESAGMGLRNGLTAGLAPKLGAGLQKSFQEISNWGSKKTDEQKKADAEATFRDALKDNRAGERQASEQHGLAYGGAKLAGNIIPQVAAMAGTGGASIPAQMLRGGLAAGVAGTGQGMAEGKDGDLGDTLKQAGIGGAVGFGTGAAAAGAGAGLGRGAQALAKWKANKIAEIQAKAAAPAIEARAAEVASQQSKNAQFMRQGISGADRLQRRGALDTLKDVPEELKGGLGHLMERYEASPFEDVVGSLKAQAAHAAAPKIAPMSAAEVAEAGEKAIKFNGMDALKGMAKKGIGMAGGYEIADHLGGHSPMMGMLGAAVGGGVASSPIAQAMAARGMASMGGAALSGLKGATAMAPALLREYNSKGEPVPSTGLPSAMPDAAPAQNVADAVPPKAHDALRHALEQNPQAMGKFAAPLQKAMERGPEAMAATHFTLHQTSPEYRMMHKNLTAMRGDASE